MISFALVARSRGEGYVAGPETYRCSSSPHFGQRMWWSARSLSRSAVAVSFFIPSAIFRFLSASSRAKDFSSALVGPCILALAIWFAPFGFRHAADGGGPHHG
jgi:hypothetical protein